MAFLPSRPRPRPERPAGTRRDATLFIVATEDSCAPRHYLRFFRHARIHIEVLPTVDGRCSPEHVVDRLTMFAERYQIRDDDQLWVVLDTDHWVEPNHKHGLLTAISDASRRGYRLAMSNPCFDLWLLLHHESVPLGTVFANCEAVGARIRSILGEFNKTNLKPEHYKVEKVLVAIQRARELEPDAFAASSFAGHWPETTGTRVVLLVEELQRAGLLRQT